jgi:protein TonB
LLDHRIERAMRDLDDATCKNIQRRARFEPALDGNGNPTTGRWGSSVRWVIPK